MTRKQKSKMSSAAPSSLDKRAIRKNYDALKTKIVLESLNDQKLLSVLASHYEVHPNQIGQWRKQSLNNTQMVFSGDKSTEQEFSVSVKNGMSMPERSAN